MILNGCRLCGNRFCCAASFGIRIKNNNVDKLTIQKTILLEKKLSVLLYKIIRQMTERISIILKRTEVLKIRHVILFTE